MTLSSKEVKKYFNSEKQKRDRQFSFFHRKIIRPLSFYLAVPFIYLNFSANQVTILGLIFGLAGDLLLTTGQHLTMSIGVAFIYLAILLDFVDGNIARYRNSSTYFGKFIDGVFGQAIYALIPFCLGIGVSRSIDQPSLLGISMSIAPIIGGGASTLMALSACTRWRYRYSTTELPALDKDRQTVLDTNIREVNKNQPLIKKVAKILLSLTKHFGDMITPLLSLVFFKLSFVLLLLFFIRAVSYNVLIHFKLCYNAFIHFNISNKS